MAFYECEDDFDLEAPDNDHLYCSKDSWIGVRPRCIPNGNGNGQDDYGDDDIGDEDLDEDEDDENNDNETGNEDDDGMYTCALSVLLFRTRLMTQRRANALVRNTL